MLHNSESRVLQRVAACCSVLECVAVHKNVSCYTTVNRVCCSVLQHVAVFYNVLQYTRMCHVTQQ